ncbi:MAG: hypothetical protein WAM58_04680 [Candidatus Acidiferrum sp.]
MSFLGSIEGFFGKVGKEFVTIFKKAPTFEQEAQTFVAIAAPATEAVLAFTDPAALPVVTPIIGVIQSKLATLSTITKNTVIPPGGSSVATDVQTILTDIESNASSVLQLASVKNSAKVSDITAEVNGIVGAVQTLATSLQSLAQASPATA